LLLLGEIFRVSLKNILMGVNEVDLYNSTDNHVVYAGNFDDYIKYLNTSLLLNIGWIGSTTTGNEYLFCSVSCMLVDFFDARKIGFIGGVLSTFGLIASAFVNDLKLYFLTYGVIFGIGQSLFLASILSILPHYFNKRLGK
jgi:MFS family permease